MSHSNPPAYYQLGTQQVLDILQTQMSGLSDQEVHQRIQKYGPNKLIQVNQEGIVWKFIKQFKDAILIILISNAIIAIWIEDYRTAIVLLIIVCINAVVGFVQEYKAEQTMKGLKKMVVSQTSVVRNSLTSHIDSIQLVPGDIVVLEEGMTVPADIRILQEHNLSSNDFALTGESNPVRKYHHAIDKTVSTAERNNLLYMGTTIASGNGLGIVIYTGMDTLIGHIAHLSQSTETEISPLQKEIGHLSKILSLATLVIRVILISLALMTHMSLYESFLFALGIASALMPQGLPSQINVALTTASNKLATQHIIIKKLSAVETMGAVNMICTDKTGTLTQNQMTVLSCMIGTQAFRISGSGYQPIGDFEPSLHSISSNPKLVISEAVNQYDIFFYTAIFASNAHIHQPDASHPSRYCIGDPTEGAIITMAEKAGYQVDQLNQLYPELYEFPFDSSRKMMSSVRIIGDTAYLCVKGAVDQILAKSTHYRTPQDTYPLTLEYSQAIIDTVDQLAHQALRNIGFAYRILDVQALHMLQNPSTQSDYTWLQAEQNLTYLGLVSMIDPPRPEVAQAMKYTHQASIQVNMVTGDYGVTAEAIARRVDMISQQDQASVIHGNDLIDQTDQEILSHLQKGSVIFCRVSPEDKLRIVSILKQAGYIVAVTGDGVNDAPALKKADIGVAMGITGTDVAKDSAEMVLMDDNFASLIQAISQGRIIFTNIKKTVIACITTNFTELFIALISLAMFSIKGWPIALTPLLILCIDLVGEMGPLTALTFDPADQDLNHQKPRNIHQHILDSQTITDLLISGLVMALIGYANFIIIHWYHHIDIAQSVEAGLYPSALSLTYASIILCQLANILVIRAGTQKSVWTSYLWSNRTLWITMLISIICICMIIYHPSLQYYLGTGPLSVYEWVMALGGALCYMLYRECHRRIRLS